MPNYYNPNNPAFTPGGGIPEWNGQRPMGSNSFIGSAVSGALAGVSNSISGNSDKGSSGASSAGGTQSVTLANPYADYMSMLERQRAEEQAARNRAAEAAKANQQQIYNTNVDKLNRTADEANQQAYINYMMSKRDLPQQLSAVGLSGGAAESSYAGLYNSYGNSRAQTEKSRLENMADLQQTLQNNLAAIEQQRLSGEMQATSEYYTNLAALQAQNAQQLVSKQQSSGGSTSGTDYAKYLQSNYYDAYQTARSNGYTADEASSYASEMAGQYIYSLLSAGRIDRDTAYRMLAGFGIQ